MHGVRKLPPGAIDEARKLSERKKIDAYIGLVAKYNEARRAMRASDDIAPHAEAVLDLTSKVVEVNPEYYTAWNDRRRVLSFTLGLPQSEPPVPYESAVSPANPVDAMLGMTADGDGGASVATDDAPAQKDPDATPAQEDPDATPAQEDAELFRRREAAATGELRLSLASLQRNIKSYWVWHHRKWVLSAMGLAPETEESLLQAELGNCERLLGVDARNFHCWGHRAWVRNRLGDATGPEDEAAATLEKIQENFSNYSAWHRRSLLGIRGRDTAGDAFALDFSEERDLVEQAFFTEPDDQSAWFYHRWLMGGTLGAGNGTVRIADTAVVDVDVDTDTREPRLCVSFSHAVSPCAVSGSLLAVGCAAGSWVAMAPSRGRSRVFYYSGAPGEGAGVDASGCGGALRGPLGEPFEESNGPGATIPTDHLDLVKSLCELSPGAHYPPAAIGWMMRITEMDDGSGESEKEGKSDGSGGNEDRGVVWMRKAAEADPARGGYYRDLEARLRFSAQVRDILSGKSPAELTPPRHTAVPAELLLRVKCLNLSGQGLNSLPSYVRELCALETLDISGNDIQRISARDLPRHAPLGTIDASGARTHCEIDGTRDGCKVIS